jgi:hypothetical protein
VASGTICYPGAFAGDSPERPEIQGRKDKELFIFTSDATIFMDKFYLSQKWYA